MERDVLHLAVPAFLVALARVSDASLRGRPVAVAPGGSVRSVIQSASVEARSVGVVPGMAVRRARRLCPDLEILPPDPRLLERGGRALLELAAHYTPLTEPVAPGRLYLDLTGGRRLLGPVRDVAARIERELEGRLGLAAQGGVAVNKLVAGIASSYLGRPGVCDVLRGAEAAFLAPLPVTVLPGIGEARELLLRDLNLLQVRELAALPVSRLRLVFGPFAPLLQQRARGIDHAPVRPLRKAAAVAEESLLPREGNDDALLLAELCRLVEGCGLRLRRLGQGAGSLVLTVRYADGMTERRSGSFAAPQDHDLLLYERAEELFRRACSRRVRIRGLRLECGELSGPRQLGLFAGGAPSRRQRSLQEALDRLREKYGMEAVRHGRTLAR